MKTTQLKTNAMLEHEIKDACYELISGIDWKLLKKQKHDLVLIQSLGVLPKQLDEIIEGVLNLLDEISDIAVDQMGIPQRDVLNLTANTEAAEKRAYEKYEKRKKEALKYIEKKISEIKLTNAFKEYNEEIHPDLTGEARFTIDESEVDEFKSWCKRMGYIEIINIIDNQ